MDIAAAVDDRMVHVVGAVGQAGNVSVGLATATLTDIGTAEALLGDGAVVVALGDVAVTAASTEDSTMTIVAGATSAARGTGLLAEDATKSFEVTGAAALGGSAGVGAGMDATTLTKRTEAMITEGAAELRAHAVKDVTALIMAGAGGGVAVSGAIGVIAAYPQTRAFIVTCPPEVPSV